MPNRQAAHPLIVDAICLISRLCWLSSCFCRWWQSPKFWKACCILLLIPLLYRWFFCLYCKILWVWFWGLSIVCVCLEFYANLWLALPLCCLTSRVFVDVQLGPLCASFLLFFAGFFHHLNKCAVAFLSRLILVFSVCSLTLFNVCGCNSVVRVDADRVIGEHIELRIDPFASYKDAI